MKITNPVTETPAASPEMAEAHFAHRLSVETDCSDVWTAMRLPDPGFVLVDVRGPNSYAKAHVPGAINIPYRAMNEERMKEFPKETIFVVYCAGPQCNASTKAGLRLARLRRPVKEMIGGITGWRDEGFEFESSEKSAQETAPSPKT
jgi:rhodanese-related sulfurtransferase